MKFLVVEKMKQGIGPKDLDQWGKIVIEDLKYKTNLEKKQKIVAGGPFLDTLGVCYVLETKTIEVLGEIFVNAPRNFLVDREVHPLGTFADTLEGAKAL